MLLLVKERMVLLCFCLSNCCKDFRGNGVGKIVPLCCRLGQCLSAVGSESCAVVHVAFNCWQGKEEMDTNLAIHCHDLNSVGQSRGRQ
jgi:hypothetical protein